MHLQCTHIPQRFPLLERQPGPFLFNGLDLPLRLIGLLLERAPLLQKRRVPLLALAPELRHFHRSAGCVRGFVALKIGFGLFWIQHRRRFAQPILHRLKRELALGQVGLEDGVLLA